VRSTRTTAVVIALITALVACGPTEGPPSISTSPPRPTNAPQATAVQTPSGETPQSTPPLSEGGREARVTRIIDGDTIEVDVGGTVFQVRYIGIDCPEAGHPLGPEATEVNRRLVENKTVRLVEDRSDVDGFDRLLRYVYVGDLLVNAEMVRLGYARAVSYPPNVLHDALFAELELQAREASAGLWAEPSQLAGYLAVDPSCCQFDSPGDDSENKEEEYVCFRNGGPEAFDLSGCTLSDEYGWIYHFPALSLDPQVVVRVRSGCGEDTAADLYWCHEGATAIWNNDGDTVYLFSPEGYLLLEDSY
jgi:endonuclease YncB( thermonuclease family)